MSRKPEKRGDAPTKKPYAAPVLTEYGTLEEITAGGNPAASNDPGGSSSGKFKK
jgi:hypothetical protein